MIRRPATTIAPATISAVIGSKAESPVDLDQAEPDQDAARGQGVGAQVRGVALEGERFVIASPAGPAPPRRPRLASTREAHDGDSDRDRFDVAPTTRRWVAS